MHIKYNLRLYQALGLKNIYIMFYINKTKNKLMKKFVKEKYVTPYNT